MAAEGFIMLTNEEKEGLNSLRSLKSSETHLNIKFFSGVEAALQGSEGMLNRCNIKVSL